MVKGLLAAAMVAVLLSGCGAAPKDLPVSDQTLLATQNGTQPSGTQPTDSPAADPDVSVGPAEPVPTEPVPTDPPQTFPTEPPGTIPTGPLKEEDFVRVLDYIPLARQYLPYATEDNFTGTVIYDFTDAYLRYGTVKKLMAVSKELEQYGYGLLIWDGYRPVAAQQKLYDVCPDPNYVSPPGVGNQNHCRGRAVDLTLVDLTTGAQLEMPTGFDDFSAKADRDYSDVSSRAAFHALLLEQTMERYGFAGYSGEWWHFNDTEDYPIEESFVPET